MTRWSDLPIEIFGHIEEWLDKHEDYVSLSMVEKRLRSFATNYGAKKRFQRLTKHVPGSQMYGYFHYIGIDRIRPPAPSISWINLSILANRIANLHQTYKKSEAMVFLYGKLGLMLDQFESLTISAKIYFELLGFNQIPVSPSNEEIDQFLQKKRLLKILPMHINHAGPHIRYVKTYQNYPFDGIIGAPLCFNMPIIKYEHVLFEEFDYNRHFLPPTPPFPPPPPLFRPPRWTPKVAYHHPKKTKPRHGKIRENWLRR